MQTLKVDVKVGRRAEALDQRHDATVSTVGLEPCAVQQVACDNALYHLQHRRDELGLRGQQQTQRDRQRQHPLPHRDMWDDVVHQVRRGLRHASRAARRAEFAPLSERQQLVVPAIAAAKPQEAVRQEASLEEGVELFLDEMRRPLLASL